VKEENSVLRRSARERLSIESSSAKGPGYFAGRRPAARAGQAMTYMDNHPQNHGIIHIPVP
jgi:hypothetical protein